MSTRSARTLLKAIVCLLCASSSPWLQASAGNDVATLMTYYYNFTPRDCGNGRLASNCSGLMLRGTDSGKGFHVWNPSPPSVKSGGVSVSYLRKDAEYQDLGLLKSNGFVLKPNDFLSRDEVKLDVKCAFPIDAWTDYRTDQGCADNSNTAEKENTCQDVGITTAADWFKDYRRVKSNHQKQCGFVMDDRGSFNKGDAFYQFIKARELIKDESMQTQTELRLGTWEQDLQPKFPVLGFIYTAPSGLKLAQSDQKDWYDATLAKTGKGDWIPVIAVKLPKTTAQDATFTYNTSDQGVPPGDADKGSCEKYIEKAEWNEKYFEPDMKKTIPSLMETPTACGRTIGPDKTNVAYAELFNLAANNKNWNWGHDGGSMRRQFSCHVANPKIAQDKPTWNLEPARPYVSHEEAVNMDCNPR
ncbi:DUF2599 domain-containing protein [Pseudomonas sp. NPDC098740]|uniref:DUF2599 domain-containing protein n=1 Tax=Pseudomonas sp. NPDC098740 TaxID=3364486 RepID=UPI00383AA8A2